MFSKEKESKELTESQGREIERLSMELEGAQEELHYVLSSKEQALLHLTRELDHTREQSKKTREQQKELLEQVNTRHASNVKTIQELHSKTVSELQQEVQAMRVEIQNQQRELGVVRATNVTDSARVGGLTTQVDDLTAQLHKAQSTIEQKERAMVNMKQKHEQDMEVIQVI